MNSLTCLNVYGNLNGSIKMRALETWLLQWSANPPIDQLSLTCSLKANRQVTAPRGNVLTVYQSGITCGEVSPTAIMAWLRGILSCCYLEGSSCTFKTKWCALQWRRFSANAVLLFFTVNIGLKYHTPLKKGRVKWKFPLQTVSHRLPVLLLVKYCSPYAKLERASPCKIFMIWLSLIKCAGVCAGNVLLVHKYRGASAEAGTVVWKSCTWAL